MHVEVIKIGTEQQPLVIIDDFVPIAQAMADDASSLEYAPRGAHYPGIRAAVPTVLVRKFLAPLTSIFADVFGIHSYDVIESWYSLVTTKPQDLDPIQRLPHFDGVEPQRLALLHYLRGDDFGGTAFYRHKATGYESVDRARFENYKCSLELDVARAGIPAAAYIDGPTELFDMVHHCPARFNRALLYRGNILHCAKLPAQLDFSAAAPRQRLTVNTFLMGDS